MVKPGSSMMRLYSVDMQGVEQLALVLVQALHLDIKHEVRVNAHLLPVVKGG